MSQEQPNIKVKAEDIKEVDFFSASDGSCPMCTMVKPKIDEMAQYITVNYIDVKDPENADIVTERGIRSIPQLWYGDIDFVGIPNIVKIMHPIINHHKQLENEQD